MLLRVVRGHQTHLPKQADPRSATYRTFHELNQFRRVEYDFEPHPVPIRALDNANPYILVFVIHSRPLR